MKRLIGLKIRNLAPSTIALEATGKVPLEFFKKVLF
jgi:hypothetical protein